MYLNTSKTRPSGSTLHLSPIEMPKFHCFTDLGLGEKPPDPDEVLRAFDQQRREKERQEHKIKLEKMYKLAMANSASAQRILSKHSGQIGLDLEENKTSGMGDMSWSLVPVKETNSRREHQDDKPWLKHLRHKSIVPIPEVSESEQGEEENKDKWIAIRTESEQSTKSKKSAGKKKPLPSIQPLALTGMGREKTIVAKCPSTLWVNYA